MASRHLQPLAKLINDRSREREVCSPGNNSHKTTSGAAFFKKLLSSPGQIPPSVSGDCGDGTTPLRTCTTTSHTLPRFNASTLTLQPSTAGAPAPTALFLPKLDEPTTGTNRRSDSSPSGSTVTHSIERGSGSQSPPSRDGDADTAPSTCGSSLADDVKHADKPSFSNWEATDRYKGGRDLKEVTLLEKQGTVSGGKASTGSKCSSSKDSVVKKKTTAHDNLKHLGPQTGVHGADNLGGTESATAASSGLTPIPETTLDAINPTIVTVERAAAAKIYLETHFNELLCGPTLRSIRMHYLKSELYNAKGLNAVTKDERLRAFYQAESDHLRETRVLKAKCIKSLLQGSSLSEHSPTSDVTSANDFEVLKTLGKGSFGVVRLVREKADVHDEASTGERRKRQVFAMKVIRKSEMLRSSQEGHLRAERDFLIASEGSNWIVPLVASFQDVANLYLVMEYMPGGDFLGLLIRENTLDESVTRFYIAEMILCVEEAHALRCIHRDIKPDNFLVSASGHLKISDFGLAFDGHWSHDAGYYNSTRYSLLRKLGIYVEGDEQDKKKDGSLGAPGTMMCSNTIIAGIEKHERPPHVDSSEPVLHWRNRCGNHVAATSVVGTSQYMAPEVVKGEKYDGRCD
ncbi:kinase-like protein [Niveomyces insectorum RCEF 264]|uniref:non-specific serine/threonine protein kinase n=1 Tax=Niveomyces insectorum RCEF 264 TaxID=1081102 RepID=A0A168AAB7_9HYPO|nr:kinase-like protein [Niveomyces insectorum RCEF 264]